MRIRSKVFLLLIGLAAITVVMTLLLARLVIDRGMLTVVNQRQVERLERAAERIAPLYDPQSGWQSVSRLQRRLQAA